MKWFLPRTCFNISELVKEVQAADVHAQHVMLATAIEKLSNKLDKVEAGLKAKLKEVKPRHRA